MLRQTDRGRRWPWVVLALLCCAPAAMAGELRLALANSTCAAMKQVGALYQQQRAVDISYVCKSSGLLAKGLAGGALTADLFLSADAEWMDYVVDKDLVVRQNVTSPLGNALVLAVPAGSPLRIAAWRDLAAPRVATVLIGDPSHAPFGRYSKQALEAAGLWAGVRDKIETRKNIELLAESLAEADAGTVGILFKSNLTGRLREVLTVNKNWHRPIRYYLAPLDAAAGNDELKPFLNFLRGRAAREVFRAERFDVAPL
jgi:molybdate transport system substrate-binding protein